MVKKATKNKKSSKKKSSLLSFLIPAIVAIIGGVSATIGIVTNQGKLEVKIEYAPTPATMGDEGSTEESEEIPTVDDIDGGGLFQDNLNVDGAEKELYYELGAMELVDTSSVNAFINSTINRCILANNYFGAQCVSLARTFWWSYAGFDVSTCGTGLAKGMMNCAEDNARDRFEIIWDTDEIQRGTWVVFDGSRTGHICMALSKVQNGYISCLGENQGGRACDEGGAATNIINLSIKNFIGGYTPIDYIEPEPEPEPIPIAPDTSKVD